MKRIYLSGPVSGMPDGNRPLFAREAARLRSLGYDVVNPMEIDQGSNPTWQSCMRKDIAELVTCDSIALLPLWRGSRGAKIERNLAVALGLAVTHVGAIEGPAA